MAITFDVTNTGDVRLSPVTVTDPAVTGIQCPQTALDPGATMTCSATAAAPAVGAQHTNTVTVTGAAVLADGTPALGDDGTPAPPATATDTAYAFSQGLPDTGADVAPLLLGGSGLLALGSLLILGAARRRKANTGAN